MDFTALLIPIIHVVTLIITGTSAVYVYRQRTAEFPQVRYLLVMVHVFYMGIVSLEFARTFVPAPVGTIPAFTQFFLSIYTISNTTFVLADVFLLTLVAVAIAYRTGGKSVLDILREMRKHRLGAVLLGGYTLYIAAAEAYMLLVPNLAFSAQTLPTIAGTREVATQFDFLYLELLLGILLVFVVYPTSLLLSARRRTTDVGVRRAFAILPITWVGIGVDLLVFNGYLLNQGTDASSIGYLFAAAAFAVTAATFRRATLLSDFFQPRIAAEIPPLTATFSGRMGKETGDITGKEFLIEVDPSSRFEEAIRDYAAELGSQQYVLFAFTAGGSPVYNSLSGLPNVRFFTMTRRVSYPKPGERPDEVLVPSADQSVLLNVLDKAVTSNPELKVAVVFDSVSDLVLTSGLEMTYKFLKQANEMLSRGKVTSIFLMTRGAHGDREVNVVKSLFGSILTYVDGQLTIQKGQ